MNKLALLSIVVILASASCFEAGKDSTAQMSPVAGDSIIIKAMPETHILALIKPKSDFLKDGTPNNSKGKKKLAELKDSLSQVKTQATFLKSLAESLKNIKEFNTALASHKDTKTISSLGEAFKHAGKLAETLSKTHASYATALPKESPKAKTQLAQSESMEGIIGILKKAYKLIGDIK